MSKRVLAMALVILAFLIFVGSPFQQAANAVAIVDDALILVIIAALAGMGIYFAAQNTSEVIAWTRTQINASGVDFTGSSYGTNTLSNVLINNRFLVKVAVLAAYIRTTFNLQDNSTVSLRSQRFMFLEDGSRVYTYNVSIPLNGQWPDEGSAYEGTLFSIYEEYEFENGTILRTHIYEDQSRQLEIVGSNGSVTRYGYIPRECIGYVFCTNYYNYSGNGYVPMKPCGVTAAGLISGITSNDNWNEIFSIISNDVLAIQTGTIDVPSDSVIDDNAGIIKMPIPWGKTMPQILDDVTAYVPEGTLIGNTTLEIEDADVVEDQVDQEATNAEQVNADPDSYQVSGLQNVFPFCIPFDLYNFVDCLAADPVAPSFEWRFYVPGIVDETIEIDLSPYDSVAQLLRTMELLLFCVGLAFVTRKIIRG